MPLSTDAVARECVVKKEGCNLINKCPDCKKEIEQLIKTDEMFADYFKQLEYLKKQSEEKMN
jgi:hypothetical protein